MWKLNRKHINLEIAQKKITEEFKNALRLIKHTETYGMKLKQCST